MLNSIISFSIRNKLIIGLFVLGLIAWGSYSLTQLPIDAVPDITNNQVLVITTSPSLGAPDVEKFITLPVEQATRNVPGIIEQRSFSRFGLSLVTIVFDDNTDVYWARQQVSERLSQVRQQIPPGMGDPQLGPVTTGLGEIFQYVVKAKPGYENRYSLTDLRTIQDWIVRRQLLGTEGVADVSSFGGLVKQYEVAVSPEKLKSFGLTVSDVFNALNENNQNAGGAYIEKGPSVLFIRSEGLVKNIEEIQNIVVKQANGVPVLVKNIADVQIGSAVRYGATVFNNEGEVTGAVVMMLKGENSSKVIVNIKEKIKKIEKTLPEGIVIEPFLDRTKMVNNAISTVEHNLMEGALIVIFVLVLFLGNLRAGLIVASVIPMAMLFAFIMMNLFGVSGNLMSLGALDFGLLVDGAVIIVEAVMHRLYHTTVLEDRQMLTPREMNAEVEISAKKMMNSAVFGQIIILIVYLPILSLQGIEGKMFKPMAETVSFAIIGAFILSLTYVPMMSSLFLSKKIKQKPGFSDKMIDKLNSWYKPALEAVLKWPKTIVAVAFVLFGVSVVIVSTLGGEFIPQLEEGDFAVDTRLLTGSSLSNTINTTQKSAGVLLSEFPEVQKVVTKIGSGEIPTDPMPLEAADMMVILKPKEEWTSAKSFPELANKMSEALKDVPGIATGFQFPVQMRFNELMTGARQDVVCKIYGDDLDTLAVYANKLGAVIKTVDGAKDLYIETVTGISQMVITYNREAIARYGAKISDVNNTLQSAYAGATAGLVFEGDRRFDLVIRMNKEQRKNPDEIGNLLVSLPDGNQVPLYLLAKVEEKEGPYQIQRENGQRKISVGFNVRGRDVQSIVTDLQQKVNAQVKMPAGYITTYGGQYENLQHATQRLSIALPVALLLIFLMLYFAFNKFKYGLLIFSAIPLSAIGGILALWLRNMPFSISAGVGFIALFGVSVLNGIVLISEMNRIKEEEHISIKDIIMKATQIRLRPVLMTASVASLGFLPMAISSGAGAEVQRPLATVVIGGLITATVLTLVVLPSLYFLFEKGWKPRPEPKSTGIAILILLALLPALSQGQTSNKLSMQQAIDIARQQNLQLTLNRMQEKYHEALKVSGTDMPKTQFSAELGNINSSSFDNRFTIMQSFAFPSVYGKQKTVLEDEWERSKLQTVLQQSMIVSMVKRTYLQLEYLGAKKRLLVQTDSIFSGYQKIAKLRYEKGESNLLEKATLDNQVAMVGNQRQLLEADMQTAKMQLALLLNLEQVPDISDTLEYTTALFDTSLLAQHPYLQLYQHQQQAAVHQTELEKAKRSPDFLLGYGNQSIIGWQTNKDLTTNYYDGGKRFSTAQVGIAVPLFNRMQKARVNAAQQNETVAATALKVADADLRMKVAENMNDYNKYRQTIDYFQKSVLPQSTVIINTAGLQYKNGEINYIEWGMLISNAINLQSQYTDVLKEINLRKIELEYLLEPAKN